MASRPRTIPWRAVAAAVVAAGAVIWALYFAHQFDEETGLVHYDAITSLDLGQVARRVAEGRGFSTGFIRPISLRFRPDLPDHPELTHPPLYILALAGAIRLRGADDLTLVLTSAFFFWACVPLLWFLGRRYLDDRGLALALALYFINPFLLAASINGGPTTFSAFLALLFFACLAWSRKGGGAAAAAAGLVAGLAILTRYSFILWILPGAAFLFFDPREGRGRRVGLFAVAAAAAIAPWLVRNLLVAGNPFFTLRGFAPVMETYFRPGYSLWRGFSAQSLLIPRRHVWAARKLIFGLRDQYLGILLLTGNFAGIFSIVAILHKFRDRIFQQLKHVLYLLILLELVYFALYRPDWYAVPAYIPWALLVGAGFFVALLDRLRVRSASARPAAAALVLLVSVVPISDKLGPRYVGRFPVHHRATIEKVARIIDPNEIVVTDVPWAVAWYGDRSAIWLPADIGDYEELRIYHAPPVAAFYLTGYYLSIYFEEKERSADWLRVYQTGWTPRDWNLPHHAILERGHVLLSREPFR